MAEPIFELRLAWDKGLLVKSLFLTKSQSQDSGVLFFHMRNVESGVGKGDGTIFFPLAISTYTWRSRWHPLL
jgi:hypothetical protein